MTRPTRTICSRKVEVLVYCECEEQRRNRRNGFPPFHTKTAITQAVWSVSIAWRPIWYNWKVVSSEFSKFGALSDWSVANTMIIDYGRGSWWVTGLLWHDPVVSYGAIILFRGWGAKGQFWPNRDIIIVQANVVPLEAQFNVVYHTKRPNYHGVGDFFYASLSETGSSKI